MYQKTQIIPRLHEPYLRITYNDKYPTSAEKLLKKDNAISVTPWCSGYHYYKTSFNSTWTQVLRRLNSCSWRVGDLRWWGSLTMVRAGNKAKCLSSVNKYHKKQFIIIIIISTQTQNLHFLATESFKVIKGISPPTINEVFNRNKENIYN